MFANGIETISWKKISDSEILAFYLSITHIPTLIKNPLRKDEHPSLGLYSVNGKKIYYIDFATRDKGDVIDLLQKMWNCSFAKAAEKIENDFRNKIIRQNSEIYVPKVRVSHIYDHKINSQVLCKTREWKEHDMKYWNSFGISQKWLEYADVYPISHKIIRKDGKNYTFPADKYAYAYVEHKEGKITIKIYQPFNKDGYKWCSGHDGSVVSLWRKIPEKGDSLVICSSLKDALCLWANTGIPALAMQGEGYYMSNTAKTQLKQRYKNIYCLFDNDKAGLIDGERFSKESGFKNVILPPINKAKDIADLYKSLSEKNKIYFKKIIYKLLKL